MNRIRHSKKQLKNALHGSYRELSRELREILSDPLSVEFFNLTKKASGALTWTGNSFFTYLASYTPSLSSDRPSEEELFLLHAIAKKKKINLKKYPVEKLFAVIHHELLRAHLYPHYRKNLICPKMKPTIVLVSGIFNEIFNTAAFEKGTKILTKKHGFKYFVPKVDGAKGVQYNAELLEKQLLDYIKKNPREKLWLLAHSKGGLDSLHFLKNNKEFANKHIVGLSTIATPLLGSTHTDHALLKLARLIHQVPKKISKNIDLIAESAQISLSKKYQENWFRKNHKLLPKKIFYSALALNAQWYESHIWMMLTKALFLIQEPNDGIVLVKQAQFPKYFKAYNLGVIEGHHLIGARSSSYVQEALIEAHYVLLTYLNAI